MVSVWVLLTPTVTLPKLTLEGITEICGCTPVPVSEIVAGEFVAVLLIMMLPDAAPRAVGAKLTPNARVCPAARLTVPEKPLTLNPAPLAATCEIVTLPAPVFAKVIVCDAELPTSIVPKLRLLALDESR